MHAKLLRHGQLILTTPIVPRGRGPLNCLSRHLEAW
jgi:hypothetical protein